MSLIKHQAKCASHMTAHGPESEVGHYFLEISLERMVAALYSMAGS